MTLVASGKVHLAFGYTVMLNCIDGLAMLVQGELQQDPFSAPVRVPGLQGQPAQDAARPLRLGHHPQF
jgi:hypothetical protein